MSESKEIKINKVEYECKDEVGDNEMAVNSNGLRYVIVRTYSAGVFAGYLECRNGQEVVLVQARRLWYWDGAASLSQLAVFGTSKPQNCKFAVAVSRVDLFQVIEILSCTETARKNIEGVAIWKC